MDLQSLIVPSKETWAEYPGLPDFKVALAYLTRDELMKIRKKASSNVVNKKTRQIEEQVDSDLFQEIYISSVIKNWTGLKYKYLAKLLPIDESAIEDLDAELEFSKDNAVTLMKNASDFDSWVTEVLDDVQNFTKAS